MLNKVQWRNKNKPKQFKAKTKNKLFETKYMVLRDILAPAPAPPDSHTLLVPNLNKL